MKNKKANSYSLNDQQEQDISKFEKMLALWKGAYQYAVVSYVGVKVAQRLRLLFGRIVLAPSRTGIIDTLFKLETEHIIAARFVSKTTSSKIASFLASARAGEILDADGVTIIGLERDRNLSIHFAPIHHPLITEGPRLPCLLIQGVSRHNLFSQVTDSRQLDWELRASNIPFDSLDELLIQCGLPPLRQMSDLTTLEVWANSPGIIGNESTITGGVAAIVCRIAARLHKGKVRVGYKVFRKNFVVGDRASVSGSALEWREENDTKIGICRVPVGDAPLLQAFLSYAGISLHQGWFADPQKHLNPRHAIHQVFDENIGLLKTILLKPEPSAFEGGVSTLFNLLGFSVVNYGRIPKLQQGPDVIAVTPNGNIGVIECTVGLLNKNDKLDKLVQRTTLIREKLTAAGYGYLQIKAAIVTPLPRSGVAANLSIASKHSIAVLCKEEIENLLKQIAFPPNPEKLFDDLKSLIPGTNRKALS
jgi:hypothetical protein